VFRCHPPILLDRPGLSLLIAHVESMEAPTARRQLSLQPISQVCLAVHKCVGFMTGDPSTTSVITLAISAS
jgi:hypothetical protein